MEYQEFLSGHRSAAEISAAITAALASQAEDERMVRQLRRRRGDVLLEGDDHEVDRLDAAVRAAERSQERAGLAVTKLRQRHAEAVQRERDAHYDRMEADARAAFAAGEALIADYGKAAGKLAAIAEGLAAVDRLFEEFHNAGLSEERGRLPSPNAALRCSASRTIPARTTMVAKKPTMTINGKPADSKFKPGFEEVTRDAEVIPGNANPPIPQHLGAAASRRRARGPLECAQRSQIPPRPRRL